MFSKIIKSVIFTVLFLALFSSTEAGQAKDKSEGSEVVVTTSAPKEIQGEISGIGNNYINVIYNRDAEKGVEYEMMLPLDGSEKFEYKKGIKDFAIGEIVKIIFEDITEVKKEEEKLNRKVKVISFMGPAPKKAAAYSFPEPGE